MTRQPAPVGRRHGRAPRPFGRLPRTRLRGATPRAARPRAPPRAGPGSLQVAKALANPSLGRFVGLVGLSGCVRVGRRRQHCDRLGSVSWGGSVALVEAPFQPFDRRDGGVSAAFDRLVHRGDAPEKPSDRLHRGVEFVESGFERLDPLFEIIDAVAVGAASTRFPVECAFDGCQPSFQRRVAVGHGTGWSPDR